MSPWRKRLFETTRGRILALLRRGHLTVDELARQLGVTDNAVRAQLISLERDGLVEQRGVRRGPGKPSFAYGLTDELEPMLSRAYPPLLIHLLRTLDDRLGKTEVAALLEDAGDRWAAEVGTLGGSPRERAEQAAAILGQLGGDVEVEESEGVIALRGYGCPLGLAVRQEPGVCGALEALLSKLIGAEVRERCDRAGAAPSCRFVLGAPS